MLDCLATQAHGLWVCIKALLHSLEQNRKSSMRALSCIKPAFTGRDIVLGTAWTPDAPIYGKATSR